MCIRDRRTTGVQRAVAKALASIASSSTSSLHDVQVRRRPPQRAAVRRAGNGEGSCFLRRCPRARQRSVRSSRSAPSHARWRPPACPQEALEQIPHDQLETLEENDSITALYLEMIWDQK